MNAIVCPNCGKEISEAFKLQIERDIVEKEQEKHKLELENLRKTTLELAAKKVEKQFELQLKQAAEEAIAKEEQNKKLIEQLTQLTIQLRVSKKEKDEAELAMQKKLMEEEEKIKLETRKKAEEENRSKVLELQKQLLDVSKANDELRRKINQGSQQTQGEAFELEFEESLQKHYPHDKILPVGKGIKGGDIIHEVWDGNGNYTGKILWELKNTKTWNEEWIEKLKSDKRAINADEAILISEVMPNDMKTAGFRKSTWVTQRSFVFALSDTIRAKIIQLYYVKNSVKGKDEKIEALYKYLSGIEFKNRVEAIIDAFSNMQIEIEKEKRYFSNKWARDEKNIRQVIDSTYGMHGDLKGIIGRVLPQIKGLGESDENKLTLEDGKKTQKVGF